jgi:hypothetical protein
MSPAGLEPETFPSCKGQTKRQRFAATPSLFSKYGTLLLYEYVTQVAHWGSHPHNFGSGPSSPMRITSFRLTIHLRIVYHQFLVPGEQREEQVSKQSAISGSKTQLYIISQASNGRQMVRNMVDSPMLDTLVPPT